MPVAILAVSALLGLKGLAFVSDGQTGGAAWAEEDPSEPQADAASEGAATAAEALFGAGHSASKDAVLESLAARRTELERREKELDLREALLKTAEARIEARIAELKEIETRIGAAVRAKTEEDEARFAALVTMYESMKAKDAAKIFDGLEMPILVKVASRIDARRMSEILAKMQPAVAQQLTIELSAESEHPLGRLNAAEAAEPGGELPKIVGTRPAS